MNNAPVAERNRKVKGTGLQNLQRQFESGRVLMDNNEKEEILNSYKWIKVKKFVDDETKSWEERFKALEKHHLEETNFLINKTREIVKQL